MPYIVSKNDFVNELLIAGAETNSVCEQICAMIEKYEPEYLAKVLGYSFYKVVLSALGDGSDVEQKYADLIDGCDYTVSEIEYHWQGLRYYTASYIYYHYQCMSFTKTAPIGEQVPTTENGTVTSRAPKMVKAYNDASWGMPCYGEYGGGQAKCYHLLYNRVDDDNVKVYPDFKPERIKHLRPINQFNL